MTTVTQADAVMETLRKMLETSNAGTVFGEPVTSDGVTVIPVAKVSGGGGGGGGTAPATNDGDKSIAGGTGGGIGLSAKPVGGRSDRRRGRAADDPGDRQVSAVQRTLNRATD